MISAATRERTLARALPPWWLMLITGIAWIVVSVILLRFDYTSVSSISLLFGFVAIAAGVVAFIHPGDTFVALAAVFSYILIFAGTFDIIIAISARHEIEVWWLQLVGGIVELVLGFWAAGYYGRSAVLLVAWVAAFAIVRGVRDLVLAFRVRELQHAT